MSFRVSALAWMVPVEKSTERLVLLALADRADDEGKNCYPSVETICGMTQMNRKTVFAVISRLAERGVLSVRKREVHNSNEYLLHIEDWPKNGSTENGSVRISVSGEVIPGAAQRGCPLYLRCSMPDLMR